MNKNLKKVISTIAALALSASCFTAFAADFSDVADTAAYKPAVDNLVALGVVNGYDDGTFGPEKEITRAEVSKMVVAAMGPNYMQAAEASKGTSSFDDVPGDHWASGYIAQGVSLKYINGIGGNKFDPESNVTFAQIVKMLVYALGYDQDATAAGGYPNGYINIGASIGVTDGVKLTGDVAVNRGQVAMLIDNALQTPINAVTGWEQGISVDKDGNLVTTMVPKTEVYDGKGDSGKYETLLTTYFDAYAVRGRITDISKGDREVDFDIEYADNFDGEYNLDTGKRTADKRSEVLIYPAGLDVDSLLCTYSDALIRENEDGDFEIVTITPYGKNDIVTLDSDLYSATDSNLTNKVLAFNKTATSSKTDDYDLDSNFKMYVNGTLINDAAVAAAITKYVENNSATTVKLINTPSAGSKSIDSKYDYIMLSVYSWAIVDDTEISESTAKIYLENYDNTILGTSSEIRIDLDAVADGDQEYTIVKADGTEVALEEVKADDVLTIYADVEAGAANVLVEPDFIDITVSDTVVEGKVTTSSQDDKDQWEYTIGGEVYKYAEDDKTAAKPNLTTGNEYTLYVDTFGRIVKSSALASALNYGIINKVWNNTSADENQMRIVNTKGALATYEIKNDADYTTWYANYTTATSQAFADVAEDMVITYKLDSQNRIYNIEPVESLVSATGEFSERQAKVGSAKMSDASVIIDFTKGTGTKWSGSLTGKVSAATLASFVDGEEYTVLYGYTDNKFSDGTYPLVIVTKGVPGISTTTSFAVVDSIGQSENPDDGITYDSINFYGAGSSELQTIYYDKTLPTVKRGDVIVYSLDNDGLVDEFNVLFDEIVEGDAGYTLEDAANFTYTPVFATDKSKLYTTATVSNWNEARSDNYARVGFGVLLDKSERDVTIGKVTTESGKYVTTYYEDVDLASDVNVYVYDYNNKNSSRISTGTVGSLLPTKIASTFIDDSAATSIYKWQEAGKSAVKTVFYKTLEDEITDVLVIVPKN